MSTRAQEAAGRELQRRRERGARQLVELARALHDAGGKLRLVAGGLVHALRNRPAGRYHWHAGGGWCIPLERHRDGDVTVCAALLGWSFKAGARFELLDPPRAPCPTCNCTEVDDSGPHLRCENCKAYLNP